MNSNRDTCQLLNNTLNNAFQLVLSNRICKKVVYFCYINFGEAVDEAQTSKLSDASDAKGE